MKITVTEDKYAYLLFNKLLDETNIINENFDPYSRVIEDRKKKIRVWLDNFGEIKQDVSNKNLYIVYKIPKIEEFLGTSYCICRLVDNETRKPRGTVVVKPSESFQW